MSYYLSPYNMAAEVRSFESKLLPKLFFGSDLDNAVSTIAEAKSVGISHVLLVSEGDYKALSAFQVTQSTVVDNQLLSKLPIFHEKISIGIQAGGMWVLTPDPVLTAVILISFLMTSLSKNLNLAKATAKLQAIAPVDITGPFEEQLQIWNNMHAKIDTKHSDWSLYMKTNKVSHEDLLHALLAQTSKKTTRYTCTKRSSSMVEFPPTRMTATKFGKSETVEFLAKKWKSKLEMVFLLLFFLCL